MKDLAYKSTLPLEITYNRCFRELHEEIRVENYDKALIFNMDESHVVATEAHGGMYTYGFRHVLPGYKQKNPSKHITIVSTISTDDRLRRAAFVVSKDLVREENFQALGLTNPSYTATCNGWMNNEDIDWWARYIFLASIKNYLHGRRALLIMDGLTTVTRGLKRRKVVRPQANFVTF